MNKKQWAAFGQRLKESRLGSGFTQTEVARRAGISKSFYCEVEKGAEIGISRLAAVAGVLGGESIDWLVWGDAMAPRGDSRLR